MVLTDNDATTGEIRQKFKCLVKDCSIEITRPIQPTTTPQQDNEL